MTDRKNATFIFDKFCEFIDGLNMNGHFVENDFMNKTEQGIIKQALTLATESEIMQGRFGRMYFDLLAEFQELREINQRSQVELSHVMQKGRPECSHRYITASFGKDCAVCAECGVEVKKYTVKWHGNVS